MMLQWGSCVYLACLLCALWPESAASVRLLKIAKVKSVALDAG